MSTQFKDKYKHHKSKKNFSIKECQCAAQTNFDWNKINFNRINIKSDYS